MWGTVAVGTATRHRDLCGRAGGPGGSGIGDDVALTLSPDSSALVQHLCLHCPIWADASPTRRSCKRNYLAEDVPLKNTLQSMLYKTGGLAGTSVATSRGLEGTGELNLTRRQQYNFPSATKHASSADIVII